MVIARTDPTPDAEVSLARFAEEVGVLGEVVLVDSSGTEPRGLGANVRVLRRPKGRLAPELWRDGLLSTATPLVAFSTAQMIPRPGWLRFLIDGLQSSGAAGVGGPIEPGPDLSTVDRAVALLRYSSYFPPLANPSGRARQGGSPTIRGTATKNHAAPPGDNALYRRDRLMEVATSWLGGFWEVEVHRALRDRGETLAMAREAVVTFVGGCGLGSMIAQRWAHAHRYGVGRSRPLGTMARLARIAVGPMIPPLLLTRAIARLGARGMAMAPWLSAVPSLAILSTVWAMGEAVGTWQGDLGATDAHVIPNHSPPEAVELDHPMESVTQLSRRAG